MKQTELLTAIQSGKLIALGDYRDFEVKEIPGKGGKPSNVICTTFVLCGRDVVQVTAFAARGLRPDQIAKPSFKLGDKVVIQFKDWQNTQWGLRANGEVSALVA